MMTNKVLGTVAAALMLGSRIEIVTGVGFAAAAATLWVASATPHAWDDDADRARAGQRAAELADSTRLIEARVRELLGRVTELHVRRNALASEYVAYLAWAQQSGEQAEERRLARPVGPQDGQHLPRGEAQVESHPAGGEPHGDVQAHGVGAHADSRCRPRTATTTTIATTTSRNDIAAAPSGSVSRCR